MELDQLLARGERLLDERLYATRTEIKAIPPESIVKMVESLPVIPTPIEEMQRDEWLTRSHEVITRLTKIKLHPKGIEKFTEELLHKFYAAQIQPGENVGMKAADAAGTNTTQMTLNTFHVAGSATNAAFGIKVIKEILDLLSRSGKSCRVVYDSLISFEEVMLTKRPQLIDVTFGDLISNSEIVEVGLDEKQPEWYTDFREIYDNVVIPRSRYYFRTTINLDHLYSFRITSEEVYAAMKDANADKQMVVVFSPVVSGAIEFHFIPNEAKIEGGGSGALAYLRTQLSVIDNRQIQGLTGIKEIYIIRVSLVKSFTKEIHDAQNNSYRIYFDPYVNKSNGIRKEYLTRLLQFVGYEVLGAHVDHLEVRAGAKPMLAAGVAIASPLELLKKLLAIDEAEQAKYEADERRRKLEVAIRDKVAAREISILRPPTAFELMANTHYVETLGGELNDILELPEIDYEATHSNDIRETNTLFGIEAARDLLSREIDLVFRNSKQPLERSSVLLMADHMTVRGFLTSFNLSGIAAHPIGTYSKSTLQKPIEYFQKAALRKESDPIRTASACIMTGRTPNLSTALVKPIFEQTPADYKRFIVHDRVTLPPQEFVADEAAEAERAAKEQRNDKIEEQKRLSPKKEQPVAKKEQVIEKRNYPPIVEYSDQKLLGKIEGRARLMLQTHEIDYEEEHPFLALRRYKLVEEVIQDLIASTKKYVTKRGNKSFPSLPEKYVREAITAWLIEQKSIDERDQDVVLPYVDTVDYAFVKRLLDRKVPLAEAEALSLKLAQQLREVVDNLTLLKKKQSLFKGDVVGSYNNKTKQWEYHLQDDELVITISSALNDKLKRDYTGKKSDKQEFTNRVFTMLLRYRMLFGSGYQGAIPESVFSVFEIEYEAFASPLNHTLPEYYSLYYDSDRYFGSKGSFFLQNQLPSGSYEVNPPFLESSIEATVNKLLEALDGGGAPPGIDKVYTFLLILPNWTDLPAYKHLIESPYNRLPNKVIVLKAQQHRFRNVAEGNDWDHGVDSFVLVLSNRDDITKYGQQFEDDLRKRFSTKLS